MTCGQVFRWERLEEGAWLGVDGEDWFHVSIEGEVARVESNAGRAAFDRLFRLDADQAAIEREVARLGPELEPYVASLPGLRLMRPSDPVESMFCFLCTPNNHLTRIAGMVRTLGAYGEPMGEVAGRTVTRFPSVEVIAGLPEAELRAKGFGYRGASIPEVARQVLARGGREWLRELAEMPYAEAHAALCDLKWVGPKLADCIALFALGNTWAVPVDTHLWQAAVRTYFPQWAGGNLTGGRYRAIGDLFRGRFGALAGWAHQYLFVDDMLHSPGRRSGSSWDLQDA